MKTCPQCGADNPDSVTHCQDCRSKLAAVAKGATDYSNEKLRNGRKRWLRVGELWVDRRCAYNDHGVVCDVEGSLSPSTTGSGPWYCNAHAWVFLHDRSAPTQEQAESWAKVRGLLPPRLRP